MTTKATPAFDIDHLTLGEIAQLEEYSGMSISEFGEDKAPKAKFLTALAYLAKRREDLTYTFEQAQTLTLSQLNAIIGEAEPGEA